MKILNNNGPKTEPWGTPLFISVHELLLYPIFTLNEICEKKTHQNNRFPQFYVHSVAG